MQSKKEIVADHLVVTLALAMSLWFPLYLGNGYDQMAADKIGFVFRVAEMGILLFAVCLMMGLQRRPGKGSGWVLAVAVAFSVSAHFSPYGTSTLLGYSERYAGLLLYLSCAAIYFVLRCICGGELLEAVCGGLMCSGVGVGLIAVGNFWSFDVLGVFSGIETPELDALVISTLGNRDFTAGFLSVSLAICLWCAVHRVHGNVDFVAFALVSAGMMASNSDGSLMGLAAAVVCLVFHPGFSRSQARRLAVTGALFFSSGVLVVCGRAIRKTTHTLDSLCGLITTPGVGLLLAIILAAVAVWLYRREKREGDAVEPFFYARIGLVAGATVLLGIALVANLFPTLPIGYLDEFFRFDISWGSYRGYLWSLLPEIYARLPLTQKVFGMGPDTVQALLLPRYTARMIALDGTTFSSLNNEYFDLLLNMGVVGLVCWCGALAAHIRAARKNSVWEPLGGACELGLVAYAVESFFNIGVSATVPVVFLLMAAALPAKRGKELTTLGWAIAVAGSEIVILLLDALNLMGV